MFYEIRSFLSVFLLTPVIYSFILFLAYFLLRHWVYLIFYLCFASVRIAIYYLLLRFKLHFYRVQYARLRLIHSRLTRIVRRRDHLIATIDRVPVVSLRFQTRIVCEYLSLLRYVQFCVLD